MNFYQMDVDAIERHYRNTNQVLPDVVEALINKLQDAEVELDHLKGVLDEFELSDNAILLRGELQDLQIDYLNLKEEYDELKYEMESLSK